MKITTQKKDLLKALTAVKLAIPKTATNQIYKTVYIKVEDGKLIFRGTDSILNVEFILYDGDYGEPGEVCVDSLFIDVIQAFSDNEIILEKTDKSFVVKQGRKKHSFSYMGAENYPSRIEVTNYSKIDPTLSSVFDKLIKSVGQNLEVERPILAGFNINPHLGYMLSSDSFRISLANVEIPGNISTPSYRTINPTLSLIKSLNGSSTLESSFGVKVGFRAFTYDTDNIIKESWEITYPSLAGDYPTASKELIDQYLSQEPSAVITVDKSSLGSILNISQMYANRAYQDGYSEHISIEKKGNEAFIKMDVPNLVDMEEILECETEGENFIIWADPRMLYEVLDNFSTEKLRIKFFIGNPLVFTISDEDYHYLQVSMHMPKEIQR